MCFFEVEAKNQEQSILNKLRHEMKNITDDFSKHVTSSEIHFGVIEQLYDDHVKNSDSQFSEIQENLSDIKVSSKANT